MTLRSAATLVLLLTFPSSTLAQGLAAPEVSRSPTPTPAPRLDLRALTSPLDVPVKLPKDRPVALRMPAVRPDAFGQSAPQQSCAESEARGRTDADARPLNKPAFFGGLAAGTAFGVLGVGGATAVSATVKPKPKAVPTGVDAACYSQGFGGKARHENVLAALWGSLAGVAVWFVIVAAGSYD